MVKYVILVLAATTAITLAYKYVGDRFPLVVGGVVVAIVLYMFLIEVWEGDGVGEGLWNIIKRFWRL